MKNFIPILSWLPNYQKAWFKNDLAAGLTVGVMLIPQGMAYAMLAGLPPIYGLYAATIPLLAYAVFGTSRQLAVGPVAMDSILVMAGVSAFAQAGSENFISIAIFLALMEGLILVALGLARLGFLVNFLSQPVISGFTSAAALIIGLSQLKYLLGVPIESSKYLHTIVIQAVEQFDEWSWITLTVGLGGIVLIKLVKKYTPQLPGALIAVILGILVEFVFIFSLKGLDIVREVPIGLPSFSIPNIHWELISELFPLALTLALVAFMEAVSVAKAIQAKHKDYEVKPNQELIAIGLSNVFGSFFQSFSVTGGFSRTAVNDQAGAKTGMASIISALLVGLTLLFLTPLFYFLPKAILASVIMVAVFGLIDLKEPIRLWNLEKKDFAMLVATFIATLTLGIANGIGVGVLISIVMVVYRSTYPHVAVLGRIKGTNYYRNILRFKESESVPEMMILRFDAQLFFANASFFQECILKDIRNEPRRKVVLVDAQPINNIDSSALLMLDDLHQSLREMKICLQFAGVKGPVRDKIHLSGLEEKIGKENFFMNVHEGVQVFEKKMNLPPQEIVLQSSDFKQKKPPNS
ncbi:MAG: solute carrier family 26 protein [Flavobacteriales bacterium]|nr:solute carrier family 26 protein [Flavobacteriales bacterium]